MNGTSFLKDIHRKKINKKKSKKIKNKWYKKGKKKDKKVPWPSSKTAQDILPRSSQSEKYVFHFPQKKKNFRFWCEWDLISTSYSKETTQSNCVKKKSGKKKGRKKKTKKCPALLRLLYFLHLITGPYRPHYRFGS